MKQIETKRRQGSCIVDRLFPGRLAICECCHDASWFEGAGFDEGACRECAEGRCESRR